ncbi:hypothetical protein [Robertmurraya siralis]|uniref:hypothetical protein n=1 Tax=Robertmurraya siralis TaxID=77777 RepID=UPI001F459F4F|nr:hypothetical protein [Robertmurraya siralis]
MEDNETKVMEWIDDHFVMNEIEVEDFPFFPCGKLIRDKNGETMVVFGALFMIGWIIVFKKHKE